MSLRDTIRYFRDHERREALTETISITRKTGVEDFVAGAYVPATTSTIYTGAARLRSQGNHVGYDANVGGADVRFNRFVLNLEHDTAVAVDDIVAVTASRFDASFVSRAFRITDVLLDGFQIHRRAMVEEIS